MTVMKESQEQLQRRSNRRVGLALALLALAVFATTVIRQWMSDGH
jgi:hypothetical protein